MHVSGMRPEESLKDPGDGLPIHPDAVILHFDTDMLFQVT